MASGNEKKDGSVQNTDQKETNKGILKPLAAAFFATSPEEEDNKLLITPKPVTKKTTPRPVMRDPEPMLGGLSTEEAKALLKEQLVGRISNEAGGRKEAARKGEEKPVAEKAVPDVKETAKKEAVKKPAAENGGKTAPKKEEPKPEAQKAKADAKSADPVKKTENKIEKKPEVSAASKEKAEPVKEKAKKQPAAAAQAAPAEPAVREKLFIEYADRSYDMDELLKRAVQVWTSVYKRSRRELWSVELYVKPQEKKVYYVLNKRKNGSIDL